MKLKKAKSSKFDLGLIAICAAGTALTAMVALQQLSPSAQTYRASRAIAKQDNALAQRQSNQNWLDDEAAKYSASKADERYRSGCVMPTEPVKEGDYAFKVSVLEAGVQVINPANGVAVGDKQIVCDDRGMTYIIAGGVTASPARSTDMALVNQRFADALGWNPKARRSDVFLDQPAK